MQTEVGDRVVVLGWSQYITRVSRIYWEDKDGRETDIQALATRVRLELEWDFGTHKDKSRVSLHDEGKIWYRYGTVS